MFVIDPIIRILGYDKGTDFSVDLGRKIAFLDKNKFPDYRFHLWQENFWIIEAKRPLSGCRWSLVQDRIPRRRDLSPDSSRGSS
jgi:hypothetical protein